MAAIRAISNNLTRIVLLAHVSHLHNGVAFIKHARGYVSWNYMLRKKRSFVVQRVRVPTHLDTVGQTVISQNTFVVRKIVDHITL